MNIVQIIELILKYAPTGITLTKEILTLIGAIHTTVSDLPSEHQSVVADLAAKALTTQATIL